MSIQHKFYSVPQGGLGWPDDFYTDNGILRSPSYDPELLIVGTFNPNTPHRNHADIFYGRNYFWPAMKNLFGHKQVRLLHTRMPKRGVPKNPLDPTLSEVFSLCRDLKLCFADLVAGVFHRANPRYTVLASGQVKMDGRVYNLIRDGRQGEVHGLSELAEIGQVLWNTENIINYLNSNPRIRWVYLTRRPTGIWAAPWAQIIQRGAMQGRVFSNLFTPSGQGSPVNNSMNRLLAHWVHNTDPNFGRLDHGWLLQHGVNPANF